jgi:hypothetical protein
VPVAIGVRADGHREVLGVDVGDRENGAFWTAFLRSLKARGLGASERVCSAIQLRSIATPGRSASTPQVDHGAALRPRITRSVSLSCSASSLDTGLAKA